MTCHGEHIVWLEIAKSLSCLTMQALQLYDERAVSGFPQSARLALIPFFDTLWNLPTCWAH